MIEDLAFIGQIAVKSSIAVLLATLGEIVAERSGILNLGVEGMMLAGALCAAAAGMATGNPLVAVAAGALAGGLLALVHGFFAVTLRVNQVLSGLALTLLGMMCYASAICALLREVWGRAWPAPISPSPTLPAGRNP
jgi:ABC-type uncharacterized transport system permease subunit